MKIIITGSLGNISKPLTKMLIAKEHLVTVISSSPGKKDAIEALGAKAAIGRLEDVNFLIETFSTADLIYCMIPLNLREADLDGYMQKIANNYVRAITQSRIKHVVLLSGWAAGIIKTFQDLENLFNALPNASITHIRPGYFYSNLFDSMGMIKGHGLMGAWMTLRYAGLSAFLSGKRGILASNFGGTDELVLVSPEDIAYTIAEEVEHPQQGKKIIYVASDKMSCNEAANIIGTSIGKPYLKWITMTTKQMLSGLKMFGISERSAESLVEMQTPIHQGLMVEAFSHDNTVWGNIRLTEFAKEFAVAYKQPSSKFENKSAKSSKI